MRNTEQQAALPGLLRASAPPSPEESQGEDSDSLQLLSPSSASVVVVDSCVSDSILSSSSPFYNIIEHITTK